MVKVNILKSGRFAFDGIHVKSLAMGEVDLSELWADQICATSWAELANVDKEPGPVITVGDVHQEEIEPDEEPVSEPDWEFVDSMDDKGILDDYASEFGVKLDRRKSLDKMKAAFKAEFD